jgi:hypothetical protein
MARCHWMLTIVGAALLSSLTAGGLPAQDWAFVGGELRPAVDALPAPPTDSWVIRGQDASAGCAADCGTGSWCADECECVGDWRDNTVLFAASDAWKNIGESAFQGGWGNNFGYRLGANTGFALLSDSPIRGQLGASYGAYDLKGEVRPHPMAVEQQLFLTGGLNRRSNVCNGDRIAWGLVFDYMHDNHWGRFDSNVNLGQLRGLISYAWDEANEFGVWGAFRAQSDLAIVNPPFPTATIRAQDQVNAFWHHNWVNGGDLYGYVGMADSPADWVFGVSGQVPLSSRLAIFGQTHYIPADVASGPAFNQEIWNISVGLVYFFGNKSAASTVSGCQGLPLLSVADNGTFGVQSR